MSIETWTPCPALLAEDQRAAERLRVSLRAHQQLMRDSRRRAEPAQVEAVLAQFRAVNVLVLPLDITQITPKTSRALERFAELDEWTMAPGHLQMWLNLSPKWHCFVASQPTRDRISEAQITQSSTWTAASDSTWLDDEADLVDEPWDVAKALECKGLDIQTPEDYDDQFNRQEAFLEACRKLQVKPIVPEHAHRKACLVPCQELGTGHGLEWLARLPCIVLQKDIDTE